MNSVGIDVSKGKSMIAVMRPFGEVVCSPFEVPHTSSELGALAKRLKSLLQYIWTRKPGSQSGFLSISCLSYNKRSNWLTTFSLGFHARTKDC